jgi:hypothetical protein
MKTRLPLIFILFFILILQSGLLNGQENLRKSIPIKQIALTGESGEQEVLLPLRDSLVSINFEIKATIISGELTIELYDPNGDKYGNFSLAGSPNSDDKQKTEFIRGQTYVAEASGSLVRFVKYPKRGFWKAKIITKNAAGVIQFNLTTGITAIKR